MPQGDSIPLATPIESPPTPIQLPRPVTPQSHRVRLLCRLGIHRVEAVDVITRNGERETVIDRCRKCCREWVAEYEGGILQSNRPRAGAR
jgi:hypothetical protein